MSTIRPDFSKLSQRVLGLQLYDDVERTIKPQLIRDLQSCLAKVQGDEGVIHITLDLWAGGLSHPAEEPIIVVQLHFVSDSWQIRRPVVALRRLSHKNLSAAVTRELEGVLLSFGIFPGSIGYILTNQAKEAITRHNIFCDYKIMCSSNRGEPDGDEMVAFLSDQMSETESPFSALQTGTDTTCVANKLQLVVKEALKSSRVVENLLSQVHNVVAFFRNSVYWSEVREMDTCSSNGLGTCLLFNVLLTNFTTLNLANFCLKRWSICSLLKKSLWNIFNCTYCIFLHSTLLIKFLFRFLWILLKWQEKNNIRNE